MTSLTHSPVYLGTFAKTFSSDTDIYSYVIYLATENSEISVEIMSTVDRNTLTVFTILEFISARSLFQKVYLCGVAGEGRPAIQEAACSIPVS